MGFVYTAIQASPGTSGITSDRRLYLAADDQTIVEEGDEKARFLLCAAGNDIPADTVRRLGLAVKDGRVVYARATVEGKQSRKRKDDETDAEVEPAVVSEPDAPAPRPESEQVDDTKQVEQPEDKQRAPSKNKSRKRGR